MQNLMKAKLPTPRLDGKPGAHAIRKHRYYMEDDGNLTPSEAAKSKKAVYAKPTYILATSREDAIKTWVSRLKDDRRITVPSSVKPSCKKRSQRSQVERLKEEEWSMKEDVEARRTVTPLISPPSLTVSDSWRLALQGIFLEMIRIYWLLSRRRLLTEVTIDQEVVERGESHPVMGFLLPSASSAIDVVLSDETSPSSSSSCVFTTLSYLTPDHKGQVDYHLILNKRGLKAMERFVDHFSRPSTLTEAEFDAVNVRLVVSSSRHFTIEPYLRLKAIPYLS
jgi:hypothetical protein